MRDFPEFWNKRGALAAALLPVSMLYGAAVRARRALYRSGVLASVRVGPPVVVVGNVLVGGTGKTPLVIALAEQLKLRGFRPGIVSRGHGGRGWTPGEVSADSDPAQTGDEPVLLAMRTAVPVWVDSDRVAACRALLAAHPGCDLIISDDGLQHYRLARDVEVLVRDERGSGNGWLLPAGPLREPPDRPADFCVTNTGSRIEGGAAPPDPRTGIPGSRPFRMQLVAAGVYRLDRPSEIEQVAVLAGKRVHAVAGIGFPKRFFDTVDALGLRARHHAFPDHHRFLASDLDFRDCDAVLMTEKDAVKCRRLGRENLFALRVRASLEPAFFDQVIAKLRGRS